MGRRPNILRTVSIHTFISEDLRAKLDLHLYSDLEGRVPNGAYRRFLEDRIKEFFERAQLDVSQFTGAAVGNDKVYGAPVVIEHLKQYLEATK